jgi:hypothetical protein
VPVRQWVLSLPYALRYRLAYDAQLVRDVLRIFVQEVFGSLRRRARARSAIRQVECGAVTFVQRFGDALNLNVHFHMLALDGVYASEEGGRLRFDPLPPPGDAEVARVAARIARRIVTLLQRRGLGPQSDAEETDRLRRDQPLLAELYGASVCGRIATGPRAGRRVTAVGDRIDVESLEALAGPRCATVSGVSVHANVCVPAHDRMRLERLCRYTGRPPLALERLSLLPDGRLLYRLKRHWRNGTTHMVFEPLELIEKLAALVPPPRFNLVRYHGILAPGSRYRGLVVPQGPDAGVTDDSGHPGCPARSNRAELRPDGACLRKQGSGSRPRNYSWAELMRRVFAQ